MTTQLSAIVPQVPTTTAPNPLMMDFAKTVTLEVIVPLVHTTTAEEVDVVDEVVVAATTTAIAVPV